MEERYGIYTNPRKGIEIVRICYELDNKYNIEFVEKRKVMDYCRHDADGYGFIRINRKIPNRWVKKERVEEKDFLELLKMA